MPIYNFVCPNGHQVELIVPMGQESIKCPKCEANATQVASVPAKFVWGKSGGWN